jgi:succinate dehydrogenase flavin-adding protein (antitoxin of CptAB toxin-antitoxin module)
MNIVIVSGNKKMNLFLESHLDKALNELSDDDVDEYEELIELWVWHGGWG